MNQSMPEQFTQKLKKPIIEKLHDHYTISIYYHPIFVGYFTYSLTIFQKVRINPNPIDYQYRHLFGCFKTAQDAIAAGLKDLGIEPLQL
jgi:hypothetical protein